MRTALAQAALEQRRQHGHRYLENIARVVTGQRIPPSHRRVPPDEHFAVATINRLSDHYPACTHWHRPHVPAPAINQSHNDRTHSACTTPPANTISAAPTTVKPIRSHHSPYSEDSPGARRWTNRHTPTATKS